MMEKRKRMRTVNFSKAEELLVELVLKRKDVIENKKTDAVMWKEKEASWKELNAEFNSVGLLVPRTTEQLQLKYKNLKKVVRKKNAKIMMEVRRTGGGANESTPLDDVEEKIKELIRLSVEGIPASFDSDSLINEILPGTVLSNQSGEEQPISHEVLFCQPELDCGVTELERSSQPQDSNISIQPTWDIVTPRLLQQRKSTPLRSKKQRYKSTSTEATQILQRKDETLKLQNKCLEQDAELNEMRKKNLLLKRKNLILEREKKKLEMEKLKLEIRL